MSDHRSPEERRAPEEPTATEPQTVESAAADSPVQMPPDDNRSESSESRGTTGAAEQEPDTSSDDLDAEVTPERPAPSRTAPPETFAHVPSPDTNPAEPTDIPFSGLGDEQAPRPQNPLVEALMSHLDGLSPEVQEAFHRQFEHGDVTPAALTQFLAEDANMSKEQVSALWAGLAPHIPEGQRNALIDEVFRRKAEQSVEPAPDSSASEEGQPSAESVTLSEQVTPEQQQEFETAVKDQIDREQDIRASDLAQDEKEEEIEDSRASFLAKYEDLGKKILIGSAKTGIVSIFVVFFFIVCGAAIIGGKGK